MRATWTIARRELKALFDQATGYILLVVFTIVNALLSFSQLDLYGVASLRPMFDFLPWVLLFLVPACSSFFRRRFSTLRATESLR